MRSKNPRRSPSRLFLRDLPQQGQEMALEEPERRYIRDVLRMRAGSPLVLFDGSGRQHRALLLEVGRRRVRVQVQERLEGKTESPVSILLAVGLLKAQKMDFVVQKACELGVSELHPVSALRAVPLLTSERSQARMRRWQKVAEEAARQSVRTRVTEVKPVANLEEVLRSLEDADLRILFTQTADRGLAWAADQAGEGPARILLLVGPEGGFTPAEEEMALGGGCVPVSLGPRTLRAETAAILAAGLVQYQFGDLRDPHREGSPET